MTGLSQLEFSLKQKENDSEPLPIELFKTQEDLPSIESLPTTIQLPTGLVNFLRQLVENTIETGKEQSAFVMKEDDSLKFSQLSGGDAKSVGVSSSLSLFKRAFLRKTALIDIHTHPEGNDSAPSIGDFEVFKTAYKGALMFLIASDTSVTILLQTQESMRFPISSKLNGMIAAFSAEKVLIDSAKLIHKQVEGNKRFVRRQSLEGEKEKLVSQLYAKAVSAVCKQSKFGYYRFEGNVLETNQATLQLTLVQ